MHTAHAMCNTMVLQGVIVIKKFKIPSVPPTTNKCIRFSNDVIEAVENVIKGTNCTFSAFVVEAVRVALDNLDDEKDPSDNN